MNNPGLKPPESVINDMSTGCDPCSLAVMPHVEPRELGELTRETCKIMHWHSKAAPWQHRQSLTGPLLAAKHAAHLQFTIKQSQSVAKVVYTPHECLQHS